MAMFIVPFYGNYDCDITGWLQINEQFGGPLSSYGEHINNFFYYEGISSTIQAFFCICKVHNFSTHGMMIGWTATPWYV